MVAKKMNKLEKKELFAEMFHHCKDKESYSVREVIQRMGYTYEQFEALAGKSKLLLGILDFCKQVCGDHAEHAGLTFKLLPSKAFEYMFESLPEYQELYPTPEAREAVLRDCREEEAANGASKSL